MSVTADSTMQLTAAPIIRREGEGERRLFTGGVITMKASAAETNGAFMLFEDRMPRGKLTPLHIHPDEDETFIMLEGEISVYHAGSEQRVSAGSILVVPRGVPHAFIVTSEWARILALQTPGSGEAFIRDASEAVTSDTDLEKPADWDRLHVAAQNHPNSIQILGPPPFQMVRG